MKKTITVEYEGIKSTTSFDPMEKPLYTKKQHKEMKKKVDELDKQYKGKLLTEEEKASIIWHKLRFMLMDKYFAVLAA